MLCVTNLLKVSFVNVLRDKAVKISCVMLCVTNLLKVSFVNVLRDKAVKILCVNALRDKSVKGIICKCSA